MIPYYPLFYGAIGYYIPFFGFLASSSSLSSPVLTLQLFAWSNLCFEFQLKKSSWKGFFRLKITSVPGFTVLPTTLWLYDPLPLRKNLRKSRNPKLSIQNFGVNSRSWCGSFVKLLSRDSLEAEDVLKFKMTTQERLCKWRTKVAEQEVEDFVASFHAKSLHPDNVLPRRELFFSIHLVISPYLPWLFIQVFESCSEDHNLCSQRRVANRLQQGDPATFEDKRLRRYSVHTKAWRSGSVRQNAGKKFTDRVYDLDFFFDG